MTAASACFFAAGLVAIAGCSKAVGWVWVGAVAMEVVLRIVVVRVRVVAAGGEIVMREWEGEGFVIVVGAVLKTVARSCWIIVRVAEASVMVLVSVVVMETVAVVVVVSGITLLSGLESASEGLGVGASFAEPAALGVGMSLSRSVMLGVGMSLLMPGMLGVGMSLPFPGGLGDGMSFPAAAALGAALSFPTSLSFSFLGDGAETMDPKRERGKSFIVASCWAEEMGSQSG